MNAIENLKTNLKGNRKYIAIAAVIVIFSLICEVFIFNFKCITSLADKPLSISPECSGAQISGDTIRFTSNSAELIFNDVNSKIKYIHFNPGKSRTANITVSAKDEANAGFLSAPERTVCGDVRTSQYIRMNFSGKIDTLKLSVNNLNGSEIDIDDIGLNSKVPMCFSVYRFLFLMLTLAVLYMIRPKSPLYKYKVNIHNLNQALILLLIFAVQAVFLWNMFHWNKPALTWQRTLQNHTQYTELAKAIKEGHLYIDDDVQDELINMENPYDTSERAKRGVSAKWDHSFYNGKYYVYFGIAPVVTMYLPYNLITGGDLLNYIALYIICLFTIIGIMLLLWEIIKKWYRDTPFITYALLSVVFGAVSGFGYAVYKPDLYMIPPMMAVMFGVIGLACWLSAERKVKTNKDTKTVFVPWRLAFGSSCIALIAGCRPQLLLAVVFGIILFFKAVFKERRLFSKGSIKGTTAICIPFIIVAAGIMWYNAARFGSPFDFGANYNLTTNDMTHRGIKAGRIGLGLFTYLFQPIKMDAVFPFLHDFKTATVYQGLTLSENLIGGIFMIFPILIIGLYGAFRKKRFKNHVSYSFVYVSLLAAALLAVLDAQMAGLLTRYFTDFVWLAMLAVCITVFAYYDFYRDNAEAKRKITCAVTMLSALTLVMVFLRIFAHSEDSILAGNPALYYKIQHIIAFWM